MSDVKMQITEKYYLLFRIYCLWSGKKGSIGTRRGPGFNHLKIWMFSDERGVCPRKPPDSLVFRMFLVKINQPVENRIITLGFLPKICQPVPRLGLDLDRCKGHLILLCLTIPSM